jgi:hypothetical protein
MKVLPVQSKKLRIFIALFVITCLAIGAFLPVQLLHAHADESFCQGGATCKQIFANGYGKNATFFRKTGAGSSSLQVTLRAYQIVGTGENKNYMLFRVTVTLDPASFQNRVAAKPLLGNNPPPDTSISGDRSTIQVRLWSTNVRTASCPTSTCVQSGDTDFQQNYPDLEKPYDCTPDGGSQSSSWTAPVLNIGWQISVPTFQWCTYAVPNVDIFSRYYNYQLKSNDQESVPITQDFVFAQVAPTSVHQFKIGLFVKSNLMDIAGPSTLYMDGPTGNTSATFTI